MVRPAASCRVPEPALCSGIAGCGIGAVPDSAWSGCLLGKLGTFYPEVRQTPPFRCLAIRGDHGGFSHLGLTVHEPLCPGLRLGHNELLLRPAQPLKDAVENANVRLRRHLLDDAASERPSAESLVAPARVRSCRTRAGATRPQRASLSMDRLQGVSRPSMDRARTAKPTYSMVWGVLITWATVTAGGVQVDAGGRRFPDESRGYSEQAVQVLRQPGGIAWTVSDARIAAIARQFEDFRRVEEMGPSPGPATLRRSQG